jgi:hypothetical protein
MVWSLAILMAATEHTAPATNPHTAGIAIRILLIISLLFCFDRALILCAVKKQISARERFLYTFLFVSILCLRRTTYCGILYTIMVSSQGFVFLHSIQRGLRLSIGGENPDCSD